MARTLLRRAVSAVAVCCAALLSPTWSAGSTALAQSITPTAVTLDSCNSVAFSQAPGNTDYFIGRALNNTTADACSGSTWSLGLFQMDWSSNKLHLVRKILTASSLSPANSNAVITSTYDPSVVSFNGENWVAFECAGSNLGPAASCMAPMDSSFNIDTSRLNVVVSGTPIGSANDIYSASVPKLLVFQGQLYLYWTALHFQNLAGGLTVVGATTRGARLVQETSGLRRFWVSGVTGASSTAYDPAHNQEVYGANPNDSTQNFLSDTFDVKTDGTTIYVIAGVGGTGCASPLSQIYGCYRLRVSSTTSPLGDHVFNNNYLSSVELPFNPQEYTRLFHSPDGSNFLMGEFIDPILNGSPAPSQVFSSGFKRFGVDISSFLFQATGPSELRLPNPQVSSGFLYTTFPTLSAFNGGCNSNVAVSAACLSAISRLCVSQGYAGGGYGPVQYVGNDANVACVRGENATRMNLSFATLASFVPDCSASNAISDSCAAAINRSCQSQGYESGGFGPEELSNSDVVATCVHSSQASLLSASFTQLKTYQSACTGTTATFSGACMAAADVFCRNQGYVSSYGIMEHVADAATVACFKR